jgi:hypothetical protein
LTRASRQEAELAGAIENHQRRKILCETCFSVNWLVGWHMGKANPAAQI